MLTTFVIGLREGLEAALVVGIIAAFLRRHGRSLAAMWAGVAAGVAISLVVGVGLAVVRAQLDQQAQEGLETVIGAVAVVAVTGMVLWMATHARDLKRSLESSAAAALGAGTSRALALMALLAVLKEGLETAVFLLATFSAASNGLLAGAGALLGVLVAVALGYGLYTGGVRLDLARFFRATSVFLLLVAAGLVVSSLRTAHEAGWLHAGQQRTLDLAWLAPPGSLQAALVTGVLGIPADPRLVEVLGWLAYAVPMALLLFWPRRHRLGAAAATRLRAVLAGVAVVLATALALLVPAPAVTAAPLPLVSAGGTSVGEAVATASAVELRLPAGLERLPRSGGTAEDHDGVSTTHLTAATDTSPARLPSTLTAEQVATLAGGRVPVGLDPRRAPGPYDASWSASATTDAWLAGDVVLDATRTTTTAVTLTGGGLATARTVTLDPGALTTVGATGTAGWDADPSAVAARTQAVRALPASRDEVDLWRRVVPLALLVTALGLLVRVVRDRRRERDAPPTSRTTSRPVTPAAVG